MLTYDEVTSYLISDIKASGLEAYNIENTLEIKSLDKEFKSTCILVDRTPPHFIRAHLSFGWDAQLTSLSMYGNDCLYYHDETEPCAHEEEPEAMIELKIEYHIEVVKGYENEPQTIYNELMNIFKQNTDHQNLPSVTWEVTVNKLGESFLSAIKANVYWELDVVDEHELSFEGIVEEVRENLQGIERLPFIKKE